MYSGCSLVAEGTALKTRGFQDAVSSNCSTKVRGSLLDSEPWKMSPECDFLIGCCVSCSACCTIVGRSRFLEDHEKRVFFDSSPGWHCQKLGESSITFKPLNFPETTMQLYHKTFDWKLATSFTLLHSPLALQMYLGSPLTHKMQWTCWLHSLPFHQPGGFYIASKFYVLCFFLCPKYLLKSNGQLCVFGHSETRFFFK